MYFVDDTLHLHLDELTGVCAIVDMFDKNVSQRIMQIFHYHKDVLHENLKQPLQFTSLDILRCHLHKYVEITKKDIQPEFIFSDDEDIF